MQYKNITIPIYYRQFFLPTKRARRQCSIKKQTDMNFGIRELDETDWFPVAFQTQRKRDVDGKQGILEIFFDDVRVFEGKLYRPVRWRDDTFTVSRYFKNKADFCSFATALSKSVAGTEHNPKRYSYMSVKTTDNIQHVISQMKSIISDFLLYNNKVYQQCNQPIYRTEILWRKAEVESVRVIVDFGNAFQGEIFSAFERSKVIQLCKNRASEHDVELTQNSIMDEYIEVLLPEYVKEFNNS